MRPIPTLLRLVPFPILLCSCASMINKGNQAITINTTPSGAAIYENGAEVGTTPYIYTYDKTDGHATDFDVRLEGHENRTFSLTPMQNNGVLLADALLLNIPYYAGDSHSKQMFSFPRKDMNLTLYRVMPKDVQHIDLPIVTMRNAVQGGSYGKMGAKKMTSTSREMDDLQYPEQFTSSLVQGMQGTFVDPHTVKPGTQKGDEMIRHAKMKLHPVLKELKIQLTDVHHKTYGKIDMRMEWDFYSGIDNDSLLFSIDKSTTYAVFEGSEHDVLTDATKDAARQMLDEDGLYEKLTAIFGAGLVRSKGGEVVLKEPQPIPFAGRKDMLAALVKAVVTIETTDGHGSGFLISNDGYLLTNAHVVGEDNTVKVRFEQGFTLDGQVVKVNKDFDVALVKVAGNDLASLTIGDDSALQLGEELFAIGTPLDEKLGQTVTRGIMSGRREIESRSFIQTDVSINPGNSGGPLIEEDGKVVGVATMKVMETGVQGIGFGVPIGKAMEMLNIRFTK